MMMRGRPSLDPSTVLRVSGPTSRNVFRLSAAGMTDGGTPSRFLAEPGNDRVNGRRGAGERVFCWLGYLAGSCDAPQ